MSKHHCRICELFEAINNSDDPDTAQDIFMQETMEGLMDYLFDDDVYLYLDDKYRKQFVVDMSEQDYQALLSKIKEKEPHLKLVPSRETDRTLN